MEKQQIEKKFRLRPKTRVFKQDHRPIPLVKKTFTNISVFRRPSRDSDKEMDSEMDEQKRGKKYIIFSVTIRHRHHIYVTIYHHFFFFSFCFILFCSVLFGIETKIKKTQTIYLSLSLYLDHYKHHYISLLVINEHSG